MTIRQAPWQTKRAQHCLPTTLLPLLPHTCYHAYNYRRAAGRKVAGKTLDVSNLNRGQDVNGD